MANETVPGEGAAAAENPERKQLVFHAAAEIEVLVDMLARERKRDDSPAFDVLLSSMLRRIYALNSVILSVTGGDDERETEEMREVIHG